MDRWTANCSLFFSLKLSLIFAKILTQEGVYYENKFC